MGRSSGVMKSPSSPTARPRRAISAASSAGPIGRREFRARCASTTASPGSGLMSTPTFLLDSRPPGSSRKASRPRDARSSIAVVSARREVPPSMIIAPDAAVRSGGGAGMWIDGVVEIDRVLAEPPPVEERPAGQAEQDDRRADQPDGGVDLARASGARRRARGSPRHRPSGGPRRGRRRSRPLGGAGACRCRRSPGARRSRGRPPRTRERRRAGPGHVRGSGPCRRRSPGRR